MDSTRTSAQRAKMDVDSTTFTVEYVSPIALAFAIKNYNIGVEMTTPYTPGDRFFILDMKNYRMDIHGYDVGYEIVRFSAKIHKREDVGCVYGVPVCVEPDCLNPFEFKIKSLTLPKKGSSTYYPTTREEFMELLDEKLNRMYRLMPRATFDKESRTWFIGEYGFSLDEGKEV